MPVLMSESARPRLAVAPEAFERAVTVWLKTMPPSLWRQYQRMLTIDQTRLTEDDRVDPREVVAAYMREKLEQAKWEVSYLEPGKPFNTPPWDR